MGASCQFLGHCQPGNIHTKHNAGIIRVRSPTSSYVSPPLSVSCADIQGQRNFGMRSLNEMLWWCLELFLPDVIEAGDNTLPTGYLWTIITGGPAMSATTSVGADHWGERYLWHCVTLRHCYKHSGEILTTWINADAATDFLFTQVIRVHVHHPHYHYLPLLP